ncbi:MAG: hydantoinase B/oxoprolinase family protein, partial [Pseudomonadota bacterium]
FFPAIFGPNADQPLDAAATRARFDDLSAQIDKSPEEIADGFLKIANENMAAAIKKISVQRGYDVSDYALNVFGGAGAQHACAVADALGVGTCLVHPMASLLSAYGMGLADIRAQRQQSVEEQLGAESLLRAAALLDQLGVETLNEVADQLKTSGVYEGPSTSAPVETSYTLHLKIKGTDTALEVPYGTLAELKTAFEIAHRTRFGFVAGDRPLVIDAVSVESVGHAADISEDTLATQSREETEVETASVDRFFSDGAWREARFVKREAMQPGDALTGPAVLVEPHTAIIVEDGWRARITAHDHVVLTRVTPLPDRRAIGTKADPAMLEVFNSLYMSIAEQMGAVLENTAVSVTIKERLDFSCAVFDAEGDLIANAPHMPVHLGSMNASVRTVIAQNPQMQPGDVYVLNAPYNGGTHLPDVTVVMPVWSADQSQILFYTSARGHHTDIGGLTPGSAPPDSRVITDEGVYIDNFKLVDQGHFREAEALALFRGEYDGPGAASCPYPARNPEENLADLKAQVAACQKGADELGKMVDQFGIEVVSAYMRHVQDNAEECVRRAIAALKDTEIVYQSDPGFDGEPRQICVKITVDHASRSAKIDFSGTSPQVPTNYNAPEPVTRAAVLYVFRCLVDDRIPMNEGVMKPLEVLLPKGCMLSPEYPAAVIADKASEDLPASHQCLVPGAWRHGRGPGHDEQHHLGQREVPVLRDDLRRRRRRAVERWNRASRHVGGAHPYDQLAPDRSGGVGVALSGVARRVPHSPGLGRRRRVPRRRRRAASDQVPGGNDRGHPLGPSSHPAARLGWRRAGRLGAHAHSARGRLGGRAAVGGQARSGSRRRLSHRDPGRRRLRRKLTSPHAEISRVRPLTRMLDPVSDPNSTRSRLGTPMSKP